MGDDKEHKLILWFANDDRGLVMNRTNIRVLREAFGDTVDSWAGKIIIVFPTSVDFRGKLVPALRVRVPSPKQPAHVVQETGLPLQPGDQKPAAAADPELGDEPKQSLADEMSDEIPFEDEAEQSTNPAGCPTDNHPGAAVEFEATAAVPIAE